jgi:cytoskeletal protein RodZ
MPSFGSALRHARQQRGLSLDDVARETRISTRYLRAVETEALHELPGAPYNRAYVRTYATYLGLHADRLVGDLALEEEAQTKAGRLVASPDVRATMRHVADRAQPPFPHGRSRRASAVLLGGFGGVAVVLLVGLTWFGTRRLARRHETIPIVTSTPPPLVVHPGANRAIDTSEVTSKPSRLEPTTTAAGKLVPPVEVLPRSAINSEAPHLLVPRSGVGTDVVDRELVGQSTAFPVGTRVVFWTHVTGGHLGDTIRHIWSHQGTTTVVIDLPVGGPSWRTHTWRTLVGGTEGDWIVEAWDLEGRVLTHREFRCVP